MSPVWSGHKLKKFNVSRSFEENEISKNQYIERNILWSMIKISK